MPNNMIISDFREGESPPGDTPQFRSTKENPMKKHASTILLVFILIIGLSLLLYPSFADWWNSFHQTQVIANYTSQVANIDDNKYSEIWDAAREYNRSLLDLGSTFLLPEEKLEEYNTLLNIGNNGIMGYIEIPEVKIMLPVYHGTDEAVLQVAAGHLDWSSLPVGGESTHCVLSGHRGLPSARLFTDLDKLVEKDIFLLRVLDEVLTYEVDQIRIVLPHEMDDLAIVEGKDYCTLVTCTPYGINSHRMLIRGHRIENLEEAKTVRVTADAIQIKPIIVAPFVAAPMLLLLLIVLLIPSRRREKP